MKVNINFGNKIVVLPQSTVNYVEEATKTDIKVLFTLILKSENDNIDLVELAKELELKLSELTASLRFWMERNILGLSEPLPEAIDESSNNEQETSPDNACKAAGTKKRSNRLKREDELPNYTTEELSVILENRMETSQLIYECQQTFGKVFNTHEINVVLGLVDYLSLGWEYVIELIGYCARIGKRSVHYVEKLAYSMIDEGVDNVTVLKERLKELEGVWKNETFVRKLFGMKSRALTTKEKKYIGQWFTKLGYSRKIISKAYEITVNSTNEPSVPYANAILERWYSEGIRTLEEIELSEAKRAEERRSSEKSDGSFDTDDFFESALQRSYDNSSETKNK